MYGCRPKDLGGCNGVSRNADKVDRLVVALAIDYLRPGGRPPTPIRCRARREGRRPRPTPGAQGRTSERHGAAEADQRQGTSTPRSPNSTLASTAARAAGRRGRKHSATPSRETQIAELDSSWTSSNERKRLILSEIIERITIKPSSRGPALQPRRHRYRLASQRVAETNGVTPVLRF